MSAGSLAAAVQAGAASSRQPGPTCEETSMVGGKHTDDHDKRGWAAACLSGGGGGAGPRAASQLGKGQFCHSATALTDSTGTFCFD